MKKLILIFVSIAASAVFASVTISVSTKTVQKTGGGGTITVTGTGAWTAVSDSGWITVKSGAAGDGDGKVMFTVGENTTADTRIGHIDVGGNIYTITQYGYTGTISPTSVTVDRNGKTGTISVTVDAGVEWSATPNVDWITVTPTSGRNVGQVTYTVATYPGVVSRSGSIAIAGQTFTVTQTGVDVNLEPAVLKVKPEADIVQIDITALAVTKWTVTPNADWVSVLDKEQGYGDYVLSLVVNANPSFAKRTTTVAVGTATLTIVQEGKPTAELAIDPEFAEAPGSGAYGNVAVYATPDAPWTAESLTPWLTISQGKEGAGNGNIKYVTSPNPTVEEREGVIKITPPYRTAEIDYYAGMIFELTPDRYGIWGHHHSSTCIDNRSATYVLPCTFTGSQILEFGGDDLPAKDDNAFAFAFTFSVGELGCVNRLMTFGSKSIYLDVENRLWIDGCKASFQIEKPQEKYQLLLNQNKDGRFTVYAGSVADETLQKVLDEAMDSFDFSSAVSMSSFVFGYATLPTPGYLASGIIYDVRMWMRDLTEAESLLVHKITTMNDSAPAYVPVGLSKWWYFPLDGNCFYATETMSYNQPNSIRLTHSDSEKNVYLGGYVKTKNRFGIDGKALLSDGAGKFACDNWRGGELYYSRTEECMGDLSISFWMMLATLPKSKVMLFKKSCTGQDIGTKSGLALMLDEDGKLSLSVDDQITEFPSFRLGVNEWTMISVLGKSANSISVYCNDTEIGNTMCKYSLGDLHAHNNNYSYYRNYVHSFTLGTWDGAFDDFTIFDGLLTAVDVRALYAASRAKVVYHTVKQGIQTATLSKTSDVVAAEGENSSVQLTLAQNVNWEATANCDWLHVTSDAEGAGSSLVTYTVDANPYVTARTGTMTIAGVTLTIEQIGLEAEVECEKTFFDSVESDMGFINVYTEANGIWTAVSNDDWIMIDPDTEEGNGAGACWFYIDDYPLTTQSRTGSITIAGKTVYITQSGYKLSIEPAVAEVGSNAGAGQIGVAASIDQVWDVLTDCDWIQIVSGRNGIGNGTVQYQFTDNTTGEARTGTIIIGGQKYTLTQRTTLPVNAQIVGNGSVTGTGNYNQGSKATLRAIPASGQVFSHWSGDAVGNDDSVEITVDIEKNVTATFIPEAAAQKLAEQKAAQGGFYTRDQIHALEMGNLVFDVDASGTARVGVQLMETSDLSDSSSWKPATLNGNPDVGQDGTVGMKVKAEGNAKFFKVVMPEQK